MAIYIYIYIYIYIIWIWWYSVVIKHLIMILAITIIIILGNLQAKFSINYTGLQGFVVVKLWVVSGVIFDVESEFAIRISLSRQNFEIFEVMCSKNGVFHYFWGYVQGARIFLGFFLRCHYLALLFPFKISY